MDTDLTTNIINKKAITFEKGYRLMLLFFFSLLIAGTTDSVAQCTASGTPYSQTFNGTSTPSCWSNYGTDTWKFSTSAAYGAGSAGDHTGNSGNYAWVDGSNLGTGDSANLVSDSIDVSGLTNGFIGFYVFSNNTNNPNDNNTLKVDFYDGSTWNDNVIVYAKDDPNWVFQVIDLSNYTITGPVLVRFTVVRSTSGSAFYNDILIDDVKTLTCPSPFSFAVDSSTNSSVSVSWNSFSSGNSYIVRWGSSGSNMFNGSSATTTGTSYTIQNLTGTSYDIYVAEICGAGDTSSYVGPISFCLSSPIPYSESFSGGFPSCWERTDAGYVSVLSSCGGQSNVLEFNYEHEATTGPLDASSFNSVKVSYDIAGGACTNDPEDNEHFHIYYWNGSQWIRAKDYTGAIPGTFFRDSFYVFQNDLTNEFKVKFDMIDGTTDAWQIDNILIEKGPPAYDIAITEFIGPMDRCGLGTQEKFKIAISNMGIQTLSPGDTLPVVYRIDGKSPVTENFILTSNLAFGDTVHYSFKTGVDLSASDTVYRFGFWNNWSLDATRSNDSLFSKIKKGYVPIAPSVSNDTICEGESATLAPDSAIGESLFFWYASMSDSEPIAVTDSTSPFITPALTQDDTFYVSRADSISQPLKITEIGTGSTDYIEIQNLWGSDFDATGYTVAVSDAYTNINTVNTAVYWDPGKFKGREVKSTDDGSGVWGSDNIFWNESSPSWAIILDDKGNVVDFVIWGWGASDIQNFSTTINGFNVTITPDDWTGAGIPICSSGTPYVRTNSDDNTASDWACGVSGSRNQTNPQLSNISFSAGSCYSPRTQVIVNVRKNPVARISVPTPVCALDSVKFVDNSTFLGIGSIVNYTWNFSATNQVNTKDATFAFPQSTGIYLVEHIVETNWGCTSSITDSVEVFAKPIANFTSDGECEEGMIEFNEDVQYPGFGNLDYVWTIDNTTYTDANPTHIFSTPGTYDITLMVNSPAGCGDTLTMQKSIYEKPVAGFTTMDTCAGTSIAINNTTSYGGSGNLTYSWDFGDQTTSVSSSPAHTYSDAGNYEIRLITKTPNGCRDTSSQMIDIFPLPIPDFSYINTCDPKEIEFTNLTSYNGDTANLSYSWAFDGTQTSTKQNPTNVFGNAQTYNVSLEVSGSNGKCVNTLTKQVEVMAQPEPEFSVSNLCFDDDAQFTYTGANPADRYIWDFGDNSQTSNLESPTHLFGQEGNYDVMLTVTYYGGRCRLSQTKTITINPVPEARFRFVEGAVLCEGDTLRVRNRTTYSGNSNDLNYDWTFGPTGSSQLENPTQVFNTAGTYDVSLVVTSNQNCSDSISRSLLVSPLPVSGFTWEEIGMGMIRFYARDSFEFDYTWNFGDPSGNTADNPVATFDYESDGTYSVNLTVVNQFGCSSSTMQDVTVTTTGLHSDPEEISLVVFPNPFTEKTNISYNLRKSSPVKVEVLNMDGKMVHEKTYNLQSAGLHTFTFEGDNTATGVYLLRLIIDDQVYNYRVVQVK